MPPPLTTATSLLPSVHEATALQLVNGTLFDVQVPPRSFKKACHKGNGHLRQTSRANDRSIYPRSVKYKPARQKRNFLSIHNQTLPPITPSASVRFAPRHGLLGRTHEDASFPYRRRPL